MTENGEEEKARMPCIVATCSQLPLDQSRSAATRRPSLTRIFDILSWLLPVILDSIQF